MGIKVTVRCVWGKKGDAAKNPTHCIPSPSGTASIHNLAPNSSRNFTSFPFQIEVRNWLIIWLIICPRLKKWKVGCELKLKANAMWQCQLYFILMYNFHSCLDPCFVNSEEYSVLENSISEPYVLNSKPLHNMSKAKSFAKSNEF